MNRSNRRGKRKSQNSGARNRAPEVRNRPPEPQKVLPEPQSALRRFVTSPYFALIGLAVAAAALFGPL
jgi:hypothetical protein